MIKLEKMSDKQPELDLIAEWRNQTLISLRTSDLTAYGKSQRKWVDGFGPDVAYYFIYDARRDYRFSTFLGYCGLDKIDPVNRTAEIGLLINPKRQKNGVGKEAVRLLLELAFSNFNLNCVFGECYQTTDNWEFWKKCGFIAEGELRARKWWDRKFYNSVMFSMTRLEWEIIR